VKSPAKKTAKPAAQQRTKASAAPSAAKKPLKAAAKPVSKVAPKSPAKKPVAKAPVKKTATKPVTKSVAKPAGKAAVKSAKAPAKKAVVKPTPKKAAAKPVARPSASKSVAKPVAKKAPAKPATKAVVAKAAPKKTVAKAPAPKSATKTVTKPTAVRRAPVVPAKTVPTPPVVVAPAKPVGKRAAKKVMMEQMTQAEVVPTHAPDAAKATFSQTSERFMTPLPVQSPVKKDAKRANNWKTTSVEQLTDADVMAMPDSEYMNDVQQAFFRRKLLQLKADMLANAGETTEHLREDTSVMPDPADRATIEEEHALELRTRDRERKLLKKIEQAIQRIDAGDYGYCDETGEPIGVGRLMARPTANLSLEAQQRRELKQKMFGD
jgi:DnaK suppressor protein